MRVGRIGVTGMAHGRIGLALVLVLAAGPALAQGTLVQGTPPSPGGVSPGQSPPAPGNSNIRSFTLRNMSGKTITQVHAHLTNDHTDLVTAQSAIRTNQAQSFGARGKACLDSVAVVFRDGKTLNADHLNDCETQTVVVRADKITLDTSARPGATASPGPSNRMDSDVAQPTSNTPGLPQVGK